MRVLQEVSQKTLRVSQELSDPNSYLKDLKRFQRVLGCPKGFLEGLIGFSESLMNPQGLSGSPRGSQDLSEALIGLSGALRH